MGDFLENDFLTTPFPPPSPRAEIDMGPQRPAP